jgi:hypothetical protein
MKMTHHSRANDARPHASNSRQQRIRPALPLIVAVTIFLLFAATFTAVFHDPRPSDVPVGIVAPAAAVAEIEQRLESASPGAFTFTPFESPSDVETALLSREVDAAFVLAPDQSKLLVASAAGDAVASATTAAFTRIAEAQGQPITVQDLRPLPENDSRGATAFFLVLGVVLSSILFQAVSSLTDDPRQSIWERLGLLTGFALSAGITAGAISAWLVSAYPDHFWHVASLTMLLALTVAGFTAALYRLLGLPGIGLSALTMILLGISSSGGPMGMQVVPGWLQWLSPILPPGATVEAVRNTVYFDAQAVAGPLIVLTIWLTFALTALFALDIRRRGAGESNVDPATA